jgi:uncharacterized protein YodC (DUF2158 family)
MDDVFRTGDIVKVRGLGTSPKMVVIRHGVLERDPNDSETKLLMGRGASAVFESTYIINMDKVLCEWFDSNRKVHAKSFLAALLVKVDADG